MLLGADFLRKHEAILDCQNGTLVLGAHTIPIHAGYSHTAQTDCMEVTLRSNIEIAGRTIQLILCKVNGNFCDSAGFIEPPSTGSGLPKYVAVAQSLSKVTPNNQVLLQIMNISPSQVKMYKGMKLGYITPLQNILVTENGPAVVNTVTAPPVNLETSDLPSSEKSRLLELLTEFADIFAETESCLGRSHIVKHSITTTGMLIRQPLRRTPVALRNVVNDEVTKMLQRGIVQPSSSPWSSLS